MISMNIKKECSSCLLCADAPCSKNCPHNIDPAKIIRSLRFTNYQGAFARCQDICLNCDAPCEKHCLAPNSVRIKDILSYCLKKKKENPIENKHGDIHTDICGIPIENPFLLSSSVL